MTTRIFIILDKSGSMEDCKTETIEGFNTFLKSQREIKNNQAFISLFQFSDSYEKIYENIPVENAPELTDQTFEPQGTTALLDAIGRTINSTEVSPNESVIMVIITDGQENASDFYSREKINALISNRKEKGWEFVFLGANQDAIAEAGRLGIHADSSLTFSTSETKVAFESLGSAISRSRSTPIKSISFTPQERTNSLCLEN